MGLIEKLEMLMEFQMKKNKELEIFYKVLFIVGVRIEKMNGFL